MSSTRRGRSGPRNWTARISAPFAGMTQIRFDGSALGSALSAPRTGTPRVDVERNTTAAVARHGPAPREWQADRQHCRFPCRAQSRNAGRTPEAAPLSGFWPVRWRRWESNPRPQSRMRGFYERIRRSDLILQSPRRRGSAGPASMKVPGSAEAGLTRQACVSVTGCPTAGWRGPIPPPGLVPRRGRTHESPHLWFSRVFYEASRDLGSQPPTRSRPRRSLSSPWGFLRRSV